MSESTTKETVLQMRAAVTEITRGLERLEPDDALSWDELAHAFEELGKAARSSARSNMPKKHYEAPRITSEFTRACYVCGSSEGVRSFEFRVDGEALSLAPDLCGEHGDRYVLRVGIVLGCLKHAGEFVLRRSN